MTTIAPPIERNRVALLLDRMKGRRIAIVGDLMLDRYLVGDTDRLSPEAPVPVVSIRQSRLALGGAGNVAANVAAIGATGLLAGLVGDDPHGAAIRAELTARGLATDHLVSAAGRPTTTKTRVIARGQQVVRIDEEVDSAVDGAERDRLVAEIRRVVTGAEALVLEDYNKGVLEPVVIRAAIEAARAAGIPIVVDPKFRHFFEYRGATVFKPNRREMEAAVGAAADLERDPGALGAARERLGVQHLLVTMGAQGMLLVSEGGSAVEIPSRAREVFDVSGAGDTVTAWVATALAAGASALEAAYLGNCAAGVEVAKAGVATVEPGEVLASVSTSVSAG